MAGTYCTHCGRHEADCGPLSARGGCNECAVKRVTRNVRALQDRKGPEYERWYIRTCEGLAASARIS